MLGACVSGVVGRRRRRRRSRAAHRSVHVGLEFSGAERAVVDPDVVDLTLEPLGPDLVAADLQRPGRVRHRAGHGTRGDLRAVDEEAKLTAVVGRREVRPRRRGQRVRAADDVLREPRPDRDDAARVLAVGVGEEPVDEIVRAAPSSRRSASDVVAVGRTHASSVIPVVRSSDAVSAIVTRSLTPSNVRAPPFLPAVVQLGPEIEPAFPLPEESARVEPEPPSNE